MFDRKITSRTPGRFQTKVITKGGQPVIQAHYKHSKVKQYFKEGRALRTETTVGDPRVMALLACLCSFQHLFGPDNRTLRPQIAELIPGYTRGQMTYDLRRLRRKGLLRRIPKSQCYELTDHGRKIAVFFTKTHVRIVNPSLAELDPHLPKEIAKTSDLARHWRGFEQALDEKIKQAAIAAYDSHVNVLPTKRS